MMHAVKTFRVVLYLAALLAGPSFAQSQSITQASPDEVTSNTSATAPVAYVYVGTVSKGVYLYNADSSGKLTQVSGSPFQTTGLAIGSNGKYFITLGTNLVHSYPVASNGAIKGQASSIDTQDYDGADCDSGVGTQGAVLDHTGKDVYVLLDGDWYEGSIQKCTAYQAYSISTSAGDLTYNGTAEPASDAESAGVPTFTGNDSFAYAAGSSVRFVYGLIGFSRESNGSPKVLSFSESNPSGYVPLIATADPSDHLAVVVETSNDESTGPPQLASYTVDSKGNISSSNTAEEMPTPGLTPTSLNLSPSGKFLAVAGNDTSGTSKAGLQVFHFNGASPITPDGGVITTTPIDHIHWDNNNHLYAASDSKNQLFVYTITSSGISEAAGSPYAITDPNALIVVPQ